MKKNKRWFKILMGAIAVFGLVLATLSNVAALFCLLPIWGGDVPEMPECMRE